MPIVFLCDIEVIKPQQFPLYSVQSSSNTAISYARYIFAQVYKFMDVEGS